MYPTGSWYLPDDPEASAQHQATRELLREFNVRANTLRGCHFCGSKADDSLVSWNPGKLSFVQNMATQVPYGLLKN